MSIEVDALLEAWTICKEYINSKDRQAAADQLVAALTDHSLSEQEFKELVASDAYLKRAANDILEEDDDESYEDYED
jgi:hypothetical protein